MNKEIDTYHDYGKIARLITWIDILAWILLLISGVLTLLYIFRSLPTLQFSSADAWLQFMAPLPQLLQGAFWFLVLNVFKEGLYILLDIEENSRGTAASSPAEDRESGREIGTEDEDLRPDEEDEAEEGDWEDLEVG